LVDCPGISDFLRPHFDEATIFKRFWQRRLRAA
jgi:hypothetical protein